MSPLDAIGWLVAGIVLVVLLALVMLLVGVVLSTVKAARKRETATRSHNVFISSGDVRQTGDHR